MMRKKGRALQNQWERSAKLQTKMTKLVAYKFFILTNFLLQNIYETNEHHHV